MQVSRPPAPGRPSRRPPALHRSRMIIDILGVLRSVNAGLDCVPRAGERRAHGRRSKAGAAWPWSRKCPGWTGSATATITCTPGHGWTPRPSRRSSGQGQEIRRPRGDARRLGASRYCAEVNNQRPSVNASASSQPPWAAAFDRSRAAGASGAAGRAPPRRRPAKQRPPHGPHGADAARPAATRRAPREGRHAAATASPRNGAPSSTPEHNRASAPPSPCGANTGPPLGEKDGDAPAPVWLPGKTRPWSSFIAARRVGSDRRWTRAGRAVMAMRAHRAKPYGTMPKDPNRIFWTCARRRAGRPGTRLIRRRLARSVGASPPGR